MYIYILCIYHSGLLRAQGVRERGAHVAAHLREAARSILVPCGARGPVQLGKI